MERLVKRPRGAARARESAPAYGSEDAPPQPLGFKVTVSDRGRMVLPAEVRERLKIKDGDWLTLILEPDGVIRMLTGEVWTDTFVNTLRRLAGPNLPSSDDLIAERRREAAKEEREIQKTIAWMRRKHRR
jgi:AbrB family looped-hinge helix DNA binding protein